MINLFNINCMDFLKSCKDNQYALAIVDPPYGIGEDGKSNHSRSKKAKSRKYTPKGWDNSPPNKEYFTELQRVSINQIIFGANHFIENIPNANSSSWIVWDKKNGKNDFADCELAWTSFKSAVRLFRFRWHGMLQENMKDKEIRIHPTQKPVALYKWILSKYAKQGDNILDTHLGSGSVALACEELGFCLDGCELDFEYFEKAKKRLNRYKAQQRLF